ncbi:MAG TPA: hypothetical protein VK427_09220 [Kofleriaceae bacterium]|nr:hypothetical protein [Kofleriaceae bacterium]
MSESADANARLEAELARLGADHEPKPGWQSRVLAATQRPRARRRGVWFAAPALAAVAVVVIVLVTRSPAPDALTLRVEIASSAVVVRGSSAKIGDTLRATARGGRHRAVWIYREETQLVMACPGGASCRVDSGSLSAEITLRAPGRYQIVAAAGDVALPAPAGSFDGDVAAVDAARVRFRTETVDVR